MGQDAYQFDAARSPPLLDAAVRWFEAESERWFLWGPVFLATGIALYFAWPDEPSRSVGLLILAGATSLVVRFKGRGPFGLMAVAVGLTVTGVIVAEWRAYQVSAPVIMQPRTATVTAVIEEMEPAASGRLRLLLKPLQIDISVFENPEELPVRIRLSVPVGHLPYAGTLSPGDTVTVRARLLPPPAPVAPHAFDYARQVYFQRLGATGFSLSRFERIGEQPESGFALWIAALRAGIAQRILEVLPGASGGVAVALIVGERSAIPEPVAEALRSAGLAHILAISGLHMALFAGSLFWGLRLLLAAIPPIALRYAIKKWAALGALIGAAGYLLISGMSIATQRAFVMIALMFIAIMLDRPALTMRNVALAATIILLLTPEALLSASFQMSFAAVVCLIAAYERGGEWMVSQQKRGGGALEGMVVKAWRYVAALSTTSFVAGFATAPYAAFHFNRIAVYGLLANLLAMPMLGTLVMPMALAALLLMPFGLERAPLLVMGLGIDGIIWSAHWVTSLPGAVVYVPAGPISALILLSLGGVWVCFWQYSPRWLGVGLISLALLQWHFHPQPTLWVARDMEGIGVRVDERLIAFTPGVGSYTTDMWTRRAGIDPAQRQAQTVANCDVHGCVMATSQGLVIAFSKTLAGAVEDCGLADIVVAQLPLPRRVSETCQAELVIDARDVWEGGALAVYSGEGEWQIVSTQIIRGERPWVR